MQLYERPRTIRGGVSVRRFSLRVVLAAGIHLFKLRDKRRALLSRVTLFSFLQWLAGRQRPRPLGNGHSPLYCMDLDVVLSASTLSAVLCDSLPSPKPQALPKNCGFCPLCPP